MPSSTTTDSRSTSPVLVPARPPHSRRRGGHTKGGKHMPKVSKASLEAQDFGGVEVREGEAGDYTIDFLSFRETQDMTPMFVGLPDGRCQCPHWGVVLKGR